MRSIVRASLVLSICLAPGATNPCAAQDQGLGVGPRVSLIRGDVRAETSAERFTGGQLRAHLSRRTAIELSLDRRSQSSEDSTQRTRDYPLQASLLLYPVRSTFSPYVLGGAGWYTHRVETLADEKVVESETTRKFGYHGGFGAELRLGRHAGLHADYRYTFLHFGSKAVESDTIAGAIATGHASDSSRSSRFLPSYDGSMWTVGLTVYF